MFSKAKMGMMLGALAAVLSAGTVSGVYAATNDQAQAEQAAKPDGQTKEKQVWFKGVKGDWKAGEGKLAGGKVLFKGKPLEENEDLLQLLNLSADELKESLKAGQSLAAIAKEQGASVEDVVNLIVKQQAEQLAEAVKEGKLTQEQADRMSEHAAERVQKMVESTHGGKEKGIRLFFHGKNTGMLELLKLDEETFAAEVKAGKSLAEIAEAQGVDASEVIAFLTKQRESQLAEAVEAGKLTQEEADERKAGLAEAVKRQIEHKRGEHMKKVVVDE